VPKERISFLLRDKNIKIVAYSSLVPLERWREKPNQDSAKSQDMKEIGADNASPFKRISGKYKVSEAQLLLKWGLQMGFVTLPTSLDENRMRENFDLSFEIDDNDMKEISTMDKGDGVAWPNGNPSNSE
jgi:2,5-diketo-D-gluconate reductase A